MPILSMQSELQFKEPKANLCHTKQISTWAATLSGGLQLEETTLHLIELSSIAAMMWRSLVLNIKDKNCISLQKCFYATAAYKENKFNSNLSWNTPVLQRSHGFITMPRNILLIMSYSFYCVMGTVTVHGLQGTVKWAHKELPPYYVFFYPCMLTNWSWKGLNMWTLVYSFPVAQPESHST